ncbi:MAG: CAP domain-containing protein, partial [Lachnospiraceae bacterium]|nr:CAP domain-containing protein [Lachnospiraceae bacterium]
MKRQSKVLAIFFLIITMASCCFPMNVNAASKTPYKISANTIKGYSITSSDFKVKWGKAKYANKYQVAYKAPNKSWKYKTVKSTSTTLSGLSSSTTYAIKIRGINGSRKAKWSTVKKVTTISIPQDMLQQVNAQRKKAGVPALKLYSPINKTSQIKAKDMYKEQSLSHYSSTLGNVYDQYSKSGIVGSVCGENIARYQIDVKEVMSSWMNSKGHKANILDREYTDLGVGYYKGYWVQQFIGNPTPDIKVTCNHCHKTFSMYDSSVYWYTSIDDNGCTYKMAYCVYCQRLVEKCPKCKNGTFESVGINQNGALAEKCNKCGYSPDKECITNCKSCGSKMLDHAKSQEFYVAF